MRRVDQRKLRGSNINRPLWPEEKLTTMNQVDQTSNTEIHQPVIDGGAFWVQAAQAADHGATVAGSPLAADVVPLATLPVGDLTHLTQVGATDVGGLGPAVGNIGDVVGGPAHDLVAMQAPPVGVITDTSSRIADAANAAVGAPSGDPGTHASFDAAPSADLAHFAHQMLL